VPDGLAAFGGAYLVRPTCKLAAARFSSCTPGWLPLLLWVNNMPCQERLPCRYLPYCYMLTATPTLVLLHDQAGWSSLEAAHHACLNLAACVFTTGLVANALKSQVAPRMRICA